MKDYLRRMKYSLLNACDVVVEFIKEHELLVIGALLLLVIFCASV